MKASPFQGIDHIGITVPDIEQATQFFIQAFDAELIYESKSPSDPPVGGKEAEKALNLAPGTRAISARMLRLRYGPGLELFQMEGSEQREPVRPSDYGLQHFAIYVDDMSAAFTQVEAAGGVMFSAPQPILFPVEAGEGNLFCYGRTPWGSVVELITYPSPMPYEKQTPLRRWKL